MVLGVVKPINMLRTAPLPSVETVFVFDPVLSFVVQLICRVAERIGAYIRPKIMNQMRPAQ